MPMITIRWNCFNDFGWDFFLLEILFSVSLKIIIQ